MKRADGPTLSIHPATPDRWNDLERLFGPKGADGGCWCMFPRLTGREFAANGNRGNRAALRRIVSDGGVPGLLAYAGEQAVGWVSVGPCGEFGRLARSPLWRRTGGGSGRDGESAWSVVCFFIDPACRGHGVGRALLEAAVAHAAAQGATVVEACPVDAGAGRIREGDGWHGTVAMFASAGFTVVSRHGPTRPLMQRRLKGGASAADPAL